MYELLHCNYLFCIAQCVCQDILLAVACTHGTESDCERALQRMEEFRIAPSVFTFNTLLDRHAELRHADKALGVMRRMRESGVAPTTATFNTLLKLYVNRNDIEGAERVRTCRYILCF